MCAANVRLIANLERTVGIKERRRHDTAWAVVLERTRHELLAVSHEGRHDRVAGEARHRCAVPREVDLRGPVDDLTWLWR